MPCSIACEWLYKLIKIKDDVILNLGGFCCEYCKPGWLGSIFVGGEPFTPIWLNKA